MFNNPETGRRTRWEPESDDDEDIDTSWLDREWVTLHSPE
jgi:hypothetical protein